MIDPTDNVRRDRAAGAVLASAAGDALGAPHEFGPALDPSAPLTMTGGGSFGWSPGEWTDDTQTALAVLAPLARGVTGAALVTEVASGLLAWMASGPVDVGNQTRAVLGAALRAPASLADLAVDWVVRHPDASGNGSLMRTGPLALARCSRTELADLARGISALTHASADTVESCILWTEAIRRAIGSPATGDRTVDWVGLVADGLDLLPGERRSLWAGRLDACRSTPPEGFTPNGYVVSALQAALSSLAHSPVPAGQAGRHLRLSIERAVRIGDDTDTVATIAGSLGGAYWGATAVPLEWRRVLNGRVTYATPRLRAADLDRMARMASDGGRDDPIGWPTIDSLLPYYADRFPARPLAEPIDELVTVGNVHALPGQLPNVDVVVSLCRMGRSDVPDAVEHQVVGLLDTNAADNPNLGLVLADTADHLARCVAERKRVFVHCVRAENRTPAVAAAYLIRTRGMEAGAAIDRVQALTGSRPQAFLAAGLRALAGADDGSRLQRSDM